MRSSRTILIPILACLFLPSCIHPRLQSTRKDNHVADASRLRERESSGNDNHLADHRRRRFPLLTYWDANEHLCVSPSSSFHTESASGCAEALDINVVDLPGSDRVRPEGPPSYGTVHLN